MEINMVLEKDRGDHLARVESHQNLFVFTYTGA